LYYADHSRTDKKDEEKVMGTASLIAGIGFMLVGFAVIAQGLLGTYPTLEQMMEWVVFNMVIGIPFLLVGVLLLRKYDMDRKTQ